MRTIPFGKPLIGNEEKQAVLEVLAGTVLAHGPRSHEFEAAFSSYAGGGHATTVSNCTAAMHLIYFALQIGPGDEVIVPAQTHVATAHAVELAGAKPVFVDCDRTTGNIDLDHLEEAITPRTKAIAIVHFLGMPVAMDRLMALATRRNILVLEDCALALGMRYQGVHAGLHGDAGCFSFYPVKHITTAEGGMVLSKNPDLVEKVKRLKAFGLDRTVAERTVPGLYDVTQLGFNYRLSEIQCALGIEQLKRLPGFLAKRQRNDQLLREKLRDIDEIELLETSHGPFLSSYYCLSVILKDHLASKRLEIIRELNRQGVGTSIYYPHPVPLLRYYQEKYGLNASRFPNASRISYQSIALPVGPHLTDEDLEWILRILKQAIQKEHAI